jgi:histone deacetylase 1/2
MTTDIATQLLHCETSKQLWDEAQSLAGAHTKSQIIYLKSEFHGSRKGSMKMEEYLTKMKKLSDKLKLAGNPISMSDLTIQTLNGLDADYNPIVVKLSDQESLTWVDLQAQLLAFESRLEQLNNITNLTLNASANVVNKAGYKGNKFNTNSWRGSNFRGSRGGRGRNFKPTCQVCNKVGHTAVSCDHRFDKFYSGSNSSTDGNKHHAFLASPHFTQDYDWYFDSGASNHVAHHTDKFQDLTEHNGKNSLIVGNGAKLEIVASGSSKLKNLNLHDVLYVPQITKNLLSVSKLTSDNNIIAEFDNNCCFVKDKLTGKVLLRGILKDGLYQLSNGSSQTNKDSCVYLSVKENWHRKLGHPSNNVLDKVLKICNVKTSPSDKFKFCEACQLGKSHLLPFKSSSSHAQEVLELIHTDVWGPSPINSISGFKYYVHFIDDSSRFTWIYPLKQKSDTIHAFMQFKNMVEKQFNKRIKIIQCDGGGEYKPVQKLAIGSDTKIENGE